MPYGYGYGLGWQRPAASSVWQPTDDPTTNFWFDPTFGITLNGSDVSAWSNRGSLGGTVAQATGSAQPLYVASGGPFGGLPHVSYTQANSDRLTSSLAASAWKFLHDGTGGWLAMRYRCVSGTGLRTLIDTCALSGTLAGITISHDASLQAVRFVINKGDGVLSNLVTANNSAPTNSVVSFLAAYHTGIANPVRIYLAAESVTNGTETGTPSAANPNAVFTVAGRASGGTVGIQGETADVLGGTGMPDSTLRANVFAFLARSS
jgi:hypothetical protein